MKLRRGKQPPHQAAPAHSAWLRGHPACPAQCLGSTESHRWAWVAVRNVIITQPRRDNGGSEAWPPGPHTRAGTAARGQAGWRGQGSKQAEQREARLHQGLRRDLVATLDPGWGQGAGGAARRDLFQEEQQLPA